MANYNIRRDRGRITNSIATVLPEPRVPQRSLYDTAYGFYISVDDPDNLDHLDIAPL